jgi:hypothetical protein
MATTEHKGSLNNGDIVVYLGSFGTDYGYRLVKQVWLNAIGEYRWIAKGIKIAKGSNKVTEVSSDATAFDIVSDKDLTDGYPHKWTKDPEFKKGDILVGKGKSSGKTMLFVFLSEDHVERLTPRDDMVMNDQFGYSTLSDYENNFGPLTIHRTQGYSQGNHLKFSAL